MGMNWALSLNTDPDSEYMTPSTGPVARANDATLAPPVCSPRNQCRAVVPPERVLEIREIPPRMAAPGTPLRIARDSTTPLENRLAVKVNVNCSPPSGRISSSRTTSSDKDRAGAGPLRLVAGSSANAKGALSSVWSRKRTFPSLSYVASSPPP